jgi:chlorobactene glucosyltransferase
MFLIYALAGLMGAVAAGWLVIFALTLAKMRAAKSVSAADAANFPSDAPLVSILVPARNEADRVLYDAVRSMARQDYPNVEVVAVDDRSTDATLEILEEIARSEPRVRAVRGAALPPGWFGKPWALEQAKRQARGRWILATDADVIFEPQVVRLAVSLAYRGRYDAVTLLPDLGGESFWVRVVLPVAAWMIAMVLPPEKTNDPASPVALGCGAFFLMKREAHDAVGGYEAIRDEVADDVATARALKSAGLRLRLDNAQELLFTPMYDTLGELWHGFSKNAFAGADNRLAVVLRNGALNLVATTLPMVLSAAGLGLWLGAGIAEAKPVAITALAAWAAMTLAFVPVYSALGHGARYAPLAGIANFVMVLVLANSAYRTLTGKGVAWKGQVVTTVRSAESGVRSPE